MSLSQEFKAATNTALNMEIFKFIEELKATVPTVVAARRIDSHKDSKLDTKVYLDGTEVFSLPAYRALHDFCADPAVDIKIYHTKFQRLTIDVSKPYKESTNAQEMKRVAKNKSPRSFLMKVANSFRSDY